MIIFPSNRARMAVIPPCSVFILTVQESEYCPTYVTLKNNNNNTKKRLRTFHSFPANYVQSVIDLHVHSQYRNVPMQQPVLKECLC